MNRRGSGARLLLAASLAGLALASCGRPPADRGPVAGDEGRPNIVIIVLDTARQDALSCYGHTNDTTPGLSELLQSSRLYERAYAVSSWTAPSHASLFTGLYPVAHGTTQENWSLDDELVTVGEVLSDEGYQTVGIVENPVVSEANNFDQGFSRYHEIWKTKRRPGQHDGYLALIQFRRTLARLDPRRPFFLFVNLAGPHNPYDSSMQFRNTFVSEPGIPLTSHRMVPYYLGEMDYSEAEIRHLRELYDAEVRLTDHLVGRMVEELRASGQLDDTILIVTSDHGENFGEHGHLDHVFSVYETTIRIPLIVRYPPAFAAGTIDTEPVQLTDIVPTLLELAGVDGPPTQGVSLLDPASRRNRPVFCEYYRPKQALGVFGRFAGHPGLERYDRYLRTVILDGQKLIWGSDGRHELYDLANDPAEQSNLIDVPQYAGRTRQLQAVIETLVQQYHRDRSDSPEPEIEIDEATRDALRSLGYIE